MGINSAPNIELEKSKTEANQHDKGEINKFNKMLQVFEKNNVNAGVQRENFKNLGLEDLYEKHLKKGKTEEEGTKAIEKKS